MEVITTRVSLFWTTLMASLLAINHGILEMELVT